MSSLYVERIQVHGSLCIILYFEALPSKRPACLAPHFPRPAHTSSPVAFFQTSHHVIQHTDKDTFRGASVIHPSASALL